MTALTAPPLAPVLEKLFAEADNAPSFRRELDKLPPDRRQAMAAPDADYIALYSLAKDIPLPVSRETGTLLYMLARAVKARTIVEFGTSFGISTLHLAAALKDNGGGRLIATEFEPSKVARARATFIEAGVADVIELRQGDAVETLARDLPDTIDLVLMDGAKNLYPKILALIEPRLRPGAMLVADNAGRSPEYLARVRDAARGYMSLPLGDDVELTLRLGS